MIGTQACGTDVVRGNDTEQVRYRTEINVGFCSGPGIFAFASAGDATGAGPNGAFILHLLYRAGSA
jgi:hypothetical protein